MAKRDPNFMRAQGEAFRLNKRFSGRKPGALDFDDVAMALGVLVIPNGVSGAAARLVRGKDGGRIRLNPKIREEGARRFAIGHELGHWLIHETESQMFVCSASDLRDYRDSPLEAEANYFSSELLMPTGLFRPLMEKAEPDLNLIKEWAALFRASLTATTLRFIRDSKHDCIAASIKNGVVEWSWRKSDGRRVWLKSKQHIEPGSLAWELHQGRSVPEKMEVVDSAAWLRHLPFEFSGEVQEQSISMTSYNTIFTLLWIS
jgi:Zn-dependent peptidase ImmA (M78 family)